jgi:hypothetical protein
MLLQNLHTSGDTVLVEFCYIKYNTVYQKTKFQVYVLYLQQWKAHGSF